MCEDVWRSVVAYDLDITKSYTAVSPFELSNERAQGIIIGGYYSPIICPNFTFLDR